LNRGKGKLRFKKGCKSAKFRKNRGKYAHRVENEGSNAVGPKNDDHV
jgi:hypothetical protein